jgi:hypothetical protein
LLQQQKELMAQIETCRQGLMAVEGGVQTLDRLMEMEEKANAPAVPENTQTTVI